MRPGRPPRLALWLLERALSPGEAMIGDLIEQFNGGRSGVWLWRQVVAAIVTRWVEAVFDERGLMKRKAILTLVLLSVFSFGFWAGRSPLLQNIELSPRKTREISRESRLMGTLEFLKLELDKARANNLRENTPESMQRVTDLEQKVQRASESIRLQEESHRQ